MIFFLANMVLVLNLLLVLKNPLCYPAGTEFQRLSIGLGDVRTGGWFIALGWCGPVPRQPRSPQTEWGAIVRELGTSDPWQEGAEQSECPRFLPWEALSCRPVGLGRALELWALGRKGEGS